MPRNGRSARAGAARAVDFFSGKGNEALSSLAAAAGGGVTVELSAEIIESGEYAKNDNCLPSTRSESGKPICAIARDPPPRPARQLVIAAETLC